LDLKVDEYAIIIDDGMGKVHVKKGASRVFLGAYERLVKKYKAEQVDQDRAVLVREESTGQLRLVTQKQLFVPSPTETVEQVQKIIRLANHEAMFIQDKEGKVKIHYGNPKMQTPDAPRTFFLPPYATAMDLQWSSGLDRAKRDLVIRKFDMRAQYMWFEFDCRTSDNVELDLETVMFWEIKDMPKMLKRTGNLPGDLYNQARSQFIKHVAMVTLKEFMADLHNISKAIHTEDQPFYESRGVSIHSLEVTKYKCAEARTSEVLQQIIEETTNKLNRLSQAESENEVKIARVTGQIKEEQVKGDLQKIQQENAEKQAEAFGAAEADRVGAFINGLEGQVPDLKDRIQMWQVLRKNDALTSIASSNGTMYYTPKDARLSIRTDAPHAGHHQTAEDDD